MQTIATKGDSTFYIDHLIHVDQIKFLIDQGTEPTAYYEK